MVSCVFLFLNNSKKKKKYRIMIVEHKKLAERDKKENFGITKKKQYAHEQANNKVPLIST